MNEVFQLYSEEYDYLKIIQIFAQFYFFLVYVIGHRQEKLKIEREGIDKINDEKNRIANEMHDDLGADLSNILFKFKMYQNSIDIKNIEEYHQIELFIRDIIRKTNETIWILNGDKDNIAALGNFMLRFIDDYLKNSEISYEFNDGVKFIEKKIEIDTRRNIFLLLKAAVQYCCQFLQPYHLQIDLQCNEEFLILKITSNSKKTNSKDQLMQSLVEFMGHKLKSINLEMECKSKPPFSQEIIFTIKL